MHARPLASHDVTSALALTAARPYANCFLASLLEAGRHRDLIGVFEGGALVAIASAIANCVTTDLDDTTAAVLAEYLAATSKPAALVGRRPNVELLWAALDGRWGAPRDRRIEQPLLVLDHAPSVAPDPLVRRAEPEEFDALFPCCVDMFTHEVGVSPIAHGLERSYRQRVRDTITAGRSFVRMDGDTVLFKTEIGAVSSAACQLQGVWVRGDRRGSGIAAPAIAAVATFAMQQFAPAVELYVNDFNVPARRAYERAGFRQEDIFATVFL